MQVGDLVMWNSSLDEGEVTKGTIGVLVEWDTETLPASGWVRWHNVYSWSMVYEDEVAVISVSE